MGARQPRLALWACYSRYVECVHAGPRCPRRPPATCRLQIMRQPPLLGVATPSQCVVNPGPTATAQAAVPPAKDVVELWKAVWDLWACRRRDCEDAVLPRHPPPWRKPRWQRSPAPPPGPRPSTHPSSLTHASRRRCPEEGAEETHQCAAAALLHRPHSYLHRRAAAPPPAATLSGREALHNNCRHPAPVAAGATRGDATHPAGCCPPFLARKALARRAM